MSPAAKRQLKNVSTHSFLGILVLFLSGDLQCNNLLGGVSAFQSSSLVPRIRTVAPYGKIDPFLLFASKPDQPEKADSSSYRKRPESKKRPFAHKQRNSNTNNSNATNASSSLQEKRRKPSGGLNSEIFKLRQKRNGIPLAERRLASSIDYLLQTADAAKILFATRDINDTQKILKYPDEVSFNAIISSHAKNAERDWIAPQKAEQHLRRMQELSPAFPHLLPSIFTYNSVMEAHAKSAASKSNSVRRRQQSQLAILRLFAELQASNLSPNTYTYNLVLASNARSSNEWQTLETWALEALDDERISLTKNEMVPDRQTYNQLLKGYAEVGDAGKAEHLLLKVIASTSKTPPPQPSQQPKGKNAPTQVTLVWFNQVLKALANHLQSTKTYDASFGKRADRLLTKMYTLHASGYGSNIHPDTSTYNHLLNVHALIGNSERAEALVEELDQAFLKNHNPALNLSPDRITFTTLIKAYSIRQRFFFKSPEMVMEIATNATRVFEKMLALDEAELPKLSPSLVTYNTLINIWSKVGTRDGLSKMMQLLRQMSEDHNLLPDSVTYTTLIHGWSRGIRHQARLPEAGYRAEQLLQELEQLPPSRQRDNFSRNKVYNSVITAWSKSGEAVACQKVESLLSQLEGKFFNGHIDAKPDKTTFLCMIDAYAKAGTADAEERCDALLERMAHFRDVFQLENVEADRAIYNAVLNALAKSCQPSAAEKAEEILTMMQTSSDEKLRPDIVTYSTVIDCHTKCGDGSKCAEELLRFVEGNFRGGDKSLEPNAIFYSGILQAWAKTATIEGAEKAEELLRRNIGLYEEGYEYAKPHAIMYNAVMDAIARTGDQSSGKRAEELLNEMESLYQAGDGEMKPSRRSFNAVILAYRNEGDGGIKAEAFLSRMEKLAASGRYELTPDVVSYNCVISAIVEDSNEERAADRAQAFLDRMEERSIRPDGRTYSPVIEAWLKRNDEKGHELAEMMLQQFLEKVETYKKQNTKDLLYEDAVWDVINAYRTPEEDLAWIE